MGVGSATSRGPSPMEAYGPGPWRTNQVLSGAVHLLNAIPDALFN